MNTEPADGVAVRFDLRFSPRAQREALRRGERPAKELSLWLRPDEPYWDRAVDLLSTVGDEWCQVVPVNPAFRVETLFTAPEDCSWFGGDQRLDDPVRVWKRPRVRLVVDAAPQPIDIWPSETEQLLGLVAADRERQRQARDEAKAQLPMAAWTQWFSAYRRGLIDQLKTWKADLRLWDPDVDWGSAQEELKRLAQALDDTKVSFGIGGDQIVREDALVEAHRAVLAKVAAEQSRARQQATRDRRLMEAGAWVAARGSSRLRKAAAQNMLSESLGVYRDERLKAEWPGWMWLTQGDAKRLRDVVNPSEEALDSLVNARRRDSKARLRWYPDAKLTIVQATFLGRETWRFADNAERWQGLEESLAERDTLVVGIKDAAGVPKASGASYAGYADEEPF